MKIKFDKDLFAALGLAAAGGLVITGVLALLAWINSAKVSATVLLFWSVIFGIINRPPDFDKRFQKSSGLANCGEKRKSLETTRVSRDWSEWRDLNSRPLDPQ